MNNLVIVESPTKAYTLAKFLGNEYQIEASMGHVRDLPKSDLGVDVEHGFEPRYIIPKDKIKRVNELKKVLQSAKTLWLATDPDREGEAIAWHIEQLLKGPDEGSSRNGSKQKKGRNGQSSSSNWQTDQSMAGFGQNIKRVVFHEITEDAIKEAFQNPRGIDLKLVDAQQARRVLDRIVGYKLSPILWKKVKSGLSAGRVQSVALRLIVEREEEVRKFVPVEYWTIDLSLDPKDRTGNQFLATLVSINNKKANVKDEASANQIVEHLKQSDYKILKITKKEVKRYPSPPFTTSTLQQTAANRLGMTAKKTMTLSQQLYERGLITYMRTDSVNLSSQALSSARSFIDKTFGKTYLPENSRVFKTKSKMAQEAHEAIRPTNINLTPDQLKKYQGLGRDHTRLYDLIWKRMLASQMAEAVLDNTTVEVEGVGKVDKYQLRATGSLIKFDGWLKLYGVSDKEKVKSQKEKTEEDRSEENEQEKILPELVEGEDLKLLEVLPGQHFTEPPPRFNEASLIKKLEELGIGRPSTYAAIISTIIDRFYVERVERKLIPTELGIAVNKFLVKYFPGIVDYDFTASMETELDEIAQGERDWRETLGKFYSPFEKTVEDTENTAQKINIEPELSDRKCPDCGSNLVVRFGRFGKFLACSRFPECKHTENLEEKVETPCPKCGGEIVLKRTKKGKPFYGCKNYPRCKYASWSKPEVSIKR